MPPRGRSWSSTQVPAITSAPYLISGVRLNQIDWKLAEMAGRASLPLCSFDDSTTLTDGTRELKFYHTPNAHSSGMLVGYVPDARVVFTADLVSDTFPLNPALASAVHELIKENGLSVEMITCAHGNDHVLCSICLCAREVSGHEHATPILKQVG
jgi:glyoxylase-like metal-dependent hydrolase (beta-lactamase superfamily II)